tara:strand:+ start:15919 stop:16590 length:672 start_codon:yes stop_codon:yes gene_type:complete
MKQNKIFLWIIFFLFLTTYNFDFTNNSFAPIFKIENIEIEGLELSNENEIKKKFNKLKNKSIIFIDNENLKNIINNTEFIDSFTLKKIYPNTIKIYIQESKPIAFFIKDKKKYFLLENERVAIVDISHEIKNLPLINGLNNEENFFNFYSNLKSMNFVTESIKEFNYFKVNRWDILLKDGKLIKLPSENYEISINKFLSIYDKHNFKSFKVFDFRTGQQLILK